MKNLYIITGAHGHLGNTLIRLLEKENAEIRGLILPDEPEQNHDNVTYIKGDVRSADSLRPLFENTQDRKVYVIHTAGIISIAASASPLLYDVNVKGTQNIISLCQEYSVERLIYVSSVHAIPEKDKYAVLKEIDSFSPETVDGGYAKTKALASQLVMDAAAQGLDAVILHPSGIIGPYDRSGNHLVQMITDYISGSLPACVKGGYDFVDVRDVAEGCLLAAQKGKAGECYILSNRHYEIKEVLAMVRKHWRSARRLPVLPVWFARMAVPFIQAHAKRKKSRPLYTAYSLHTLESNDKFSHNKATKELGYSPRDLEQTIIDTIRWYRQTAVLLPGRVS